ncbi:hypothetical protein TVAG_339080 [Trichomonas vaginalis G3]|uniref:Uncharacterized protein n=1 Tax=Trichomonas vaginalis (strain ATCC PRA-98 / G3) TaxID=412133 RepID=A2FMS1_TRIV3|nr:hypothetical protein TVAGG3_0300230 [Trichomonas vaginalis G3]EAX93785.1 hypothetical protein TVAG_339080 [Trichomonas vaginalis G3]KAI5527832.1 hypothetical protein TVAGG3_0300230 [Trichomonas vaginalis G3]|eukprot:XP_001306715.1 hypothetical protein [Trichomonas vaginalis G3]
MLALFALFPFSLQYTPFEGCTPENTIRIQPSEVITKSFAKDEYSPLCIQGSIYFDSNRVFTADWRFDTVDGELGSFHNDDGVELIGSRDKIPYIKLRPRDLYSPNIITIVGITMSGPSDSGFTYQVFTNKESFNKKITIDKNNELGIIAVNQNPLKFTVNRVKSKAIIKANGDATKKIGNRIILNVHRPQDDSSFTSEEVKIKCQTDSNTQPEQGFTTQFAENLFFIIPEAEGGYHSRQINDYSNQHITIFTDVESSEEVYQDPCLEGEEETEQEKPQVETMPVPDGVFCNEIRTSYSAIESYLITIGAEKTLCMKGSFVFASVDKFKVSLYNTQNLNENPVEMENPFSVAGDTCLSIIKCSDNSKECRVHAVPIVTPVSNEKDGTQLSIFTTKNSLELNHTVSFKDEKFKSFALTSYSNKKKEIEVKTNNEKVYGILLSGNETGLNKFQGFTLRSLISLG